MKKILLVIPGTPNPEGHYISMTQNYSFLSKLYNLLKEWGYSVSLKDYRRERLGAGNFKSIDIIMMSVTSIDYTNGLRIARLAGSQGIEVIMGGPHFNLQKIAIKTIGLRHYVSKVVAGQIPYENLVRDLIENKNLEKIPGLCWRDRGEIRFNSPYDPVPLWALRGAQLPDPELDKNFREKYIGGIMETPPPPPYWQGIYKPGCPRAANPCRICSCPDGQKPGNEKAYLKIFLEEIPPGCRFMRFWDESGICGDLALLKAIQEKTGGCHISTYASVLGLYASFKNDPDYFNKLRSAGVVHMPIGFESFSPPIASFLKNLSPNFGKEYVKRALKVAEGLGKAGIKITCFLVFGPGENSRTVENNIKGIEQLKTVVQISSWGFERAIPFPGSELFKIVQPLPPANDIQIFQLGELQRKLLGEYVLNLFQEARERVTEAFGRKSTAGIQLRYQFAFKETSSGGSNPPFKGVD